MDSEAWMTVFAYVVSPVAMACIIFLALWWVQNRIFLHLIKERMVVTMLSGAAFEGILIGHDRKFLKMVDATSYDHTGTNKIDGDLLLPREQVHYMQRPGKSGGHR